MDYRHEVKHIISPGDAAAIRANLTAVAIPDPHAAENGSYCIRSLYFDDPLDTALHEKLGPRDDRLGHPDRTARGLPEAGRTDAAD